MLRMLSDCHRYDIEAVRIVRQFRGHTDRITDLQMSQDARWLLSSSLDGTMRVWDVPSARCLQVSPSGTQTSMQLHYQRYPCVVRCNKNSTRNRILTQPPLV